MADPRFIQPEGFSLGHFKSADGADIRYGFIKTPGESRGIVVALTGFRESIEKYYELTRDLLAQGLDVWLMDWCDQGGSARYVKNNPQKSHSVGFEAQMKTLHQFMREVVQNPENKPLIMMAHSMGGHLGLRYLKEHAGVFDSAVLTAPMIDICINKYPRFVVEAMARLYHFVEPEKYTTPAEEGALLDTIGDWLESKHLFENNDKTGDRTRFDAWIGILRENENLRKGEATFGWLYNAFKSVSILNEEKYLKSIHTPILMQTSGKDTIVSTAAQDRAVKLLPNCERVHIPEARHEIWMEADSLRNAWLKAVNNFVSQRLDAYKRGQDQRPAA
jgi:lysophospholipase